MLCGSKSKKRVIRNFGRRTLKKNCKKKIEKRAYYQTSLFSLDCDGFILRDLVTAISTMFFVFAVSFAIVCFIVP